MAFEGYVTIEGETQGAWKGESTREAHKDKVAMLGFEWGVDSPKDVNTGRSAGRRKHKAFKFKKEFGASTPQSFQALCTNENIKKVLVELTRTTPQGQEEVYFTIEFQGCQFSSVDYATGAADVGGESSSKGGRNPNDTFEIEALALTYSSVVMTHVAESVSAEDHWDK